MREGEDWSAGKRRGVGGWGGIQSQVTFSRESSCERSAPGRRVAAPLGAQRLTEPPSLPPEPPGSSTAATVFRPVRRGTGLQ